MKAKKEKLTREEVAYHEAGHAVASSLLPCLPTVRSVTIRPDKEKRFIGASHCPVTYGFQGGYWTPRYFHVFDMKKMDWNSKKQKDFLTMLNLTVSTMAGIRAQLTKCSIRSFPTFCGIPFNYHLTSMLGDDEQVESLVTTQHGLNTIEGITSATEKNLVRKYLEYCWSLTSWFVEQKWGAIERVAEALLKKETLTGKELRALIVNCQEKQPAG